MRDNKSVTFSGMMATLLYLLSLALIFSGLSFAQIKSGTIVGTVTDPSGAIVPGAEVTVTDQGTNVSSSTVSDKSGAFTVPYLQPGIYSVTVEKAGSGLTKYTASNISLTTGQTVKIAAIMTMGASMQTVNVSAAAIELQTSSAAVQGITNEITINAIPNLTHNAFNYAALQAGVVPRGLFGDTQSTTSWGIGIDGRRQASAIGIGGGAAFSNDIQLDGVSIQGSAWNETAVLPNMDSLQEVRTITNNYSAEYGRAQGVVVFTTKSGTNQFHGSAGYRLRNDALNANSFLNNFIGLKRPPFKSNSFSGAVGGPIFKDKTFFFVSYEGLRFHKALQYTRTVPTLDERSGNFCNTAVGKTAPGAPQLLKVFDPFHVTPNGNNFNRTQLPCDLRTSPAGLAQLDPFGMAIINAYPKPNQAPDDSVLNTNNFFFQANQPFVKDVVNSRLDHHFGKHYLYGTYGLQKANIKTPRSWGPDNQYYSPQEFVGNNQSDNNWYTALGDTFVISPTVVMDARLGFNRIEADNASDEFPGYDYGQFGISPFVAGINVIPGVPPNFNIGGKINALNNTSSIHKHERQSNTDANGSLTWTRGRWTHKFGGTYRMLLSNYIDVDNSVSIVTNETFTRQQVTATGGTAGAITDPTTQGYSIASIALGAGNLTVSPGFTLRLALAQQYYALYSQNDWRATDKLTLNLGLRWDVQPGPTDRFNRLSTLDLSAKDPLFGTQGAIVFPGRTTSDRHMWKTDYKNFGPRLGAAYQLNQSMVVRGGFGITYVPSNTGFNDGPGFYGAQPFTTAVTGQPYGTTPQGVLVGKFYNDPTNTSNPVAIVNTAVVGPGADPNNPAIYGGQRRFPTNFKNGYIEQWNVFVEKSFGANWLVSAGYLGSRGRHLEVTFVPTNSIQAITPSLLSAWRDIYIATGTNPGVQQVCNPFQNKQTCTSKADGTFNSASGPLIAYGNGNIRNRSMTRIETLFPYPLQGDNIHLSNGTSDYKALQLGVTRKFSAGLQLGANYTWSRLMAISRYNAQTNQGYGDYGANNGTNNYYPYVRPEQFKLNNQISTNDVPHRLSVNWVYDLPIGRGKLLDTPSGFLNTLLGGWRVAGNFLAQSGFVAPLANGGSGLAGTLNVNNPLNNLPDRVPGVPLEVPKALQHWYDGKTSVTLPSGRVLTPCRGCFLKYNVDAFAGRTITTAAGTVLPDNFWYGNAQPSYDDLRSASRWNTNLTVEKSFKLGERYNLSLAAQATNLFNHTQFRPNVNTQFGPVFTAGQASGAKVGQFQDFAVGTTNTWGAYQLPINNASGNNAGGQAIYDARQIELVAHFTF
jgi:trimeric autotransporter adhesin